MTDRPRPYHRAAAERLLDYADEWAAQAGEPTPEAGELSCLAWAAVHALLAIHDTLTDPKPEPVTATHPWTNPLTATHPWPPEPVPLPDVDAADRYAANEAKQREEAEPDPLDEDDHRDRFDRDGMRLVRVGPHHWHPASSGTLCPLGCTALSLASWNRSFGPLAFAPEPPQPVPHADLSASEGENGAEERPDTDNAQNAILCPECDHHINTHNMEGCRRHRCDCPRTPEDVARPLIAAAAKPTWCPKCGHHTDDHHDGRCVTLCECKANTDG